MLLLLLYFQSADQAYANYYASVYGQGFKAGGAQSPQYMTANMVWTILMYEGKNLDSTRS